MSGSNRPPRAMRNIVAFALLLLPVLAVPALAHGGVIQAVPGPGQTAGGTVETLQLLFAEPVNNATVTLERDGVELPVGEVEQPVANLLELSMEPLTEEGQYIVRYAVTFDDGVDFDAGYQFSYGAAAPAPLPILASDVALDGGLGVPALLIGFATAVVAFLFGRLILRWYRFRELQQAVVAEQNSG